MLKRWTVFTLTAFPIFCKFSSNITQAHYVGRTHFAYVTATAIFLDLNKTIKSELWRCLLHLREVLGHIIIAIVRIYFTFSQLSFSFCLMRNGWDVEMTWDLEPSSTELLRRRFLAQLGLKENINREKTNMHEVKIHNCTESLQDVLPRNLYRRNMYKHVNSVAQLKYDSTI